MKRLKILKILKSCSILFILLIFSCNAPEAYIEKHEHHHLYTIDYQSIQSLSKIVPSIKQFEENYSESSRNNNETNSISIESPNLDLDNILVFTKTNGMVSYSIPIINEISENKPYFFENLHIINDNEDSFILRWTSQSNEHVFNLPTFTGKVEKFDTDYNLQSVTFYENGIRHIENQISAKNITPNENPSEYYMACDIIISCACIGSGDTYCGCDGSYSTCVNTASIICMLQNGGGGGTGSSGTGSSGTGSSAGGSGNVGSSSSTTSSETLVEVVPNEPSSPIINDKKCELFNKLKTSFEFKSLVNYYKTKTNDTIEYGVALTNLPSDQYDLVQGFNNPNEEYAVSFNNADLEGKTIDIFIHTHYTGGLNIFSPDDLYQMNQVLKNPNITTGTNFVSVVVTPSNEVYALTISDKPAFLDFGDQWLSNVDKFEGFKTLFSSSIADNYIAGYGINKNKPTNEMNFIKLLNSKSSGIKLHKANADLSQWTPLNSSKTNTVVNETPCN